MTVVDNAETDLDMKTMMDLVMRLNELDRSCRRAAANPQLTDGERASVRIYTNLVREVIPVEVRAHYERLVASEPDLAECPEIFAMAVLVSTYRSLPPGKRQKLATHFGPAPRLMPQSGGHILFHQRPPSRGRRVPGRR